MLVYLIENTINKKKYVGSTTTSLPSRRRAHLNGYNKNHRPIYEDVKKYGESAFKFSVLSTHNSYEDMRDSEIRFILKLKTIERGYNKIASSQGKKPDYFGEIVRKNKTGFKHSAKSKKRISDSKRGVSIWPNGRPRRDMINAVQKSADIRSRQIICINNNKKYKNASDAANDLGLTSSAVYHVAKGRRKATKGYSFKYLNKEV